jgi:hypothetical protein
MGDVAAKTRFETRLGIGISLFPSVSAMNRGNLFGKSNFNSRLI